MIYSSAIGGYGLMKLWEWFIVTTFGLPVLSFPSSIGVCYVVSYLTHQADTKKDERPYGELVFMSMALKTSIVLLTLFCGFIVKNWL